MAKYLSFGVSLLTSAVLMTGCSQPVNQKPTPVVKPTHPKIALVLGGGGAKGLAHIGVIKVLEQNGIKPDLIVGTSSGSIVGSLYASGKSPQQLEEIATTVSDAELLDFTLSKQGLIEGIRLQNWVNSQVGQRPIEQLPIRFASIATDLTTEKKAVFTQGNTGVAVRASSSIVGLFIPPRINNRRYGDGGMVSLVPVQTAKDMGAQKVIAVDVSGPPKADRKMDFWSKLDQTVGGIKPASPVELAQADIVIRPEVGNTGSTDTVNREATIQAGEAATLAKLGEIKQQILQTN